MGGREGCESLGTWHNLTVSIKRLSSNRSHARQALGMQRHLGCPRGQRPEDTLSGRQRHAQEARAAQRRALARWGRWDRSLSLSTLPNPLLDHSEHKLLHEQSGQRRKAFTEPHPGPRPIPNVLHPLSLHQRQVQGERSAAWERGAWVSGE